MGVTLRKTALYIFLAIFIFIVVFPYLWMAMTSIQAEFELYVWPPFPFRMVTFTLFHYSELMAYPPFVQGFINSMVVALSTTGFVMIAGSLGAYTLVRIRFKGSRALLQVVMISYMLPGVAMLIPVVIAERVLGFLDTVMGVMFAHSVFVLPLMTWFLATIFAGIPVDLEKAARVDGYTRAGCLFRVVLPLAATGFALLTVFTFIISWNELMFSSVTGVRSTRMMQPVVLEFSGPMKQVLPRAMGAGVISSLPVLLLAIILQKYIIQGIMKGAIK